jgi:hypothetical protein
LFDEDVIPVVQGGETKKASVEQLFQFAETGAALGRLEQQDGSNLVGFTQSGTGAVARTTQAKLRDTVSLKDFGAVGDGTTDDTAAVTAADAISGKVYLPAGTYDTTTASTALRGPFFGEGQIRDSANNKRAPYFSAIAAPPSAFGNWDSPDTAFNGDLSAMQRVVEHRISGATTLGQPATGYNLRRETAFEFTYTYVAPETGWNQGTATNEGRTGAIGAGRQMFHAGNGDGILHWGQIIATGTKAGSTHWLANPAAAFFGGDVFAGANGVYLQGIGDLNFFDNGLDVACQGLTFNFTRTNKTGAKSTDWTGIRLQSTQGTEGVNAWMAFVGKSDLGFDFSKSDFGTNQAAMALAANQRIYGNATNADTNSLSRFTNLGNAWLEYNSGITAWNFIVFNASIMQISNDRITMLRPPLLPTVTSSAIPGASGRSGMEYYVSDSNSTTRGATLVGGGANFVKVYSNGTNWIIA